MTLYKYAYLLLLLYNALGYLPITPLSGGAVLVGSTWLSLMLQKATVHA